MSFQDVISDTRPVNYGPTRRKKPNGSLRKELASPNQLQVFLPSTRTPQRQTKSPRSVVVTPPKENNSKKRLRSPRLSDEILHFQKLLLKLEPLISNSQQSAETQWRSRIMIRSAQEADNDIWQKLQTQENQLIRAAPEHMAWAAHSKLNRDYRRVHDNFESLLKENNLYLSDDIPAPVEWLSPAEIRKKQILQEQEDFFVRAMREREDQVKGISKSMHQVNDIYKELGRLVSSQQEKIDHVEENVRYTRASTECGRDHISMANKESCLEIAFVEDRMETESEAVDDPEFRWSMPFETITEDMKSVQNDIVGLGKDILRYSAGPGLLGRKGLIRCASEEVVSDSTYYK